MEPRDKFIDKIFNSHQQCKDCPSPKLIQSFFEELLWVLFPEYAVKVISDKSEVGNKLQVLEDRLEDILRKNPRLHEGKAKDSAKSFFDGLDEIFDLIHEDVEAMFAGDPAARSTNEVIRSYPGFYAVAAYRIAHLMLDKKIQLIPRMITEFAHGKTGIDINPGAKIGRYFCIDHGTGVVIGETTVIGDHVKIYQGVTLGALSVNKEDADKQRHPTIGDRVVIYAGATILGGKTVIGSDSTIGGNVWLTKSIPEKSKIYYQTKMYNANAETTDMYVFKNDA